MSRTILSLMAALILALCGGLEVRSQSISELTGLQQKYPGQPFIGTREKYEVRFDLENGSPLMHIESFKEIAVLKDNSTAFSESKEYFSNHYSVKKLEAYSLVPEQNQYRKVPVKTFTKSVDWDNAIYFNDQFSYNFAFPSVGKGSRLVTRYEATCNFAYLPVYFSFGSSIPIEESILSVSVPKEIELCFHLFGKDTSLIQFTKTVKGNRILYNWVAINTKTYDRDPDAPSSAYYIPHIILQIAGYTYNGKYTPVIGSLKDLYRFNYGLVSGLPIMPANSVKILADSLNAPATGDREKVRNIFRWVQKNVRYVAIEDGDNGLVPREASEVLKRRYGDCKDKTSLLVAMIRSQGLKASYAWVGSRNLPYKYSVFPSTVVDDHMIAVWWEGPGKPVLLDGTTYSHSMTEIPAFIQGKECLIEKGPDDFMLYTIPVAGVGQNQVYDSLAIELKADTVVGRGMARFTGEQRADMIRLFEGKDPAAWKDIVLSELSRISNKLIIKDVKISNINDSEEPFTVEYNLVIPGYLVRTNRNSYINLNLSRYLQQTRITENRNTPVEAEMTHDHRFVCAFHIPEGYRIIQLPEGSTFNDPEFSFRETYVEKNGWVVLTSEVSINFQVIDGNALSAYRQMITLLNRNYTKSLQLEKTEI